MPEYRYHDIIRVIEIRGISTYTFPQKYPGVKLDQEIEGTLYLWLWSVKSKNCISLFYFSSLELNSIFTMRLFVWVESFGQIFCIRLRIDYFDKTFKNNKPLISFSASLPVPYGFIIPLYAISEVNKSWLNKTIQRKDLKDFKIISHKSSIWWRIRIV